MIWSYFRILSYLSLFLFLLLFFLFIISFVPFNPRVFQHSWLDYLFHTTFGFTPSPSAGPSVRSRRLQPPTSTPTVSACHHVLFLKQGFKWISCLFFTARHIERESRHFCLFYSFLKIDLSVIINIHFYKLDGVGFRQIQPCFLFPIAIYNSTPVPRRRVRGRRRRWHWRLQCGGRGVMLWGVAKLIIFSTLFTIPLSPGQFDRFRLFGSWFVPHTNFFHRNFLRFTPPPALF